MRVLIVDDKEENLYLLSALLQGEGWAVDEAHNGSEALTLARRNPPDLIVSDLLMPVMDGYTLLRHWKADERLGIIPFVVYTATYTDPRDEKLALDFGADAFIVKPVEPDPFMAVIHEVIARKGRGELPSPMATNIQEAGLLKEYSEVLVNKLEEKVFELEQTNRSLHEEIARRQRTEEELLQSRRDWEDIFQSIGHPTVILDPEHGIVAANKACIEVTGKSLDQLLNARCHEIFLNTGKRPQVCPMKALLESGSTEKVEIEMEALGGYYLVSCNPLLDAEGNIRKVIHIATDISERKKAEEALMASEGKFKLVMETIQDVFWMASPGMKETVYISPGYERVWGRSVESLYESPQSFIEVVHPDDREELINVLHESHTEGKKFVCEYRIVSADDSVRWIHERGFPIHDDDGNLLLMCGVCTDVTDFKLSREALRESEERYRSLFEKSIDGVYSVLRDGVITDANPSFCELFGYSKEEIIGKNIIDMYLDPSERPTFQKEIEDKGFVKDYEISFRKRDGTRVDCLISSSVHLGEDGRIMGYQGILRDLTARKSLHRQLQQAQKMEAVGTLAGGVAHDFNNLLQVVLGYSELILSREDLPARSRQDLEKVLIAGKNGADLVKRLLTFSRKTEPNPLDLDLNDRIGQTYRFLQRTIPRMIDIELLLSEDLGVVHADPVQIDQLLMNLCVNARDAMPDGGKLIIETANAVIDEDYAQSCLEAKSGRYVLLRVSDTGSGMDRETLEHIFEPFFTTKGPGEGTGLGLAMVYGTVKQHHGFINCYSEVGHGTTFKVYLPAVLAEAEDHKPVVTGSAPGGTETILLVDDEDFLRELGKRILEGYGYTVLTALDGKDALDLYKREKTNISLIILDLIMSGMGGKQCLEEVLKIDPLAKVLIASGFAATGQTKEAIEMGARGFVGKPYNIKEMLRMVRKVLDEK